MLKSMLASLAAIASPASLMSRETGWSADEVNTTMCYWEQPRAIVVRDTLYLDGGDLWWMPGLSTGEYGSVVDDRKYPCTPFNMSQNISAVMGTLPKANGAANNIAPTYVDGALLGNDDEFFLFGGLSIQTSTFSSPPKGQVYTYQKYQYGAVNRPAFSSGFGYKDLTDNMTNYIAYGGGVSVPSENKAYYFGGMRSATGGPVYFGNFVNNNANITSNTLISVDMATQNAEVWNNGTLPPGVPSRANPEVVWVPVGAEGILVVLGGVDYPEWVNRSRHSSNAPQSNTNSPGYMSNIDIYDIASKKWYQQSTSMGPSTARTRGCAVVAPAKDFTSFNIYYYGGYDGIDKSDSNYSDEVWVLSLPSFIWMRISQGTDLHARAGHKCAMPYPDQMMVVGGYTSDGQSCVDGFVQLYNLTSGEWLTSYDPAKYYDYGVPKMIYDKIGGTSTGGATQLTPTPSGWADDGLAKVFQSAYQTSKITHYYPYASTAPSNGTNPNVPVTSTGSGGLPSWAPIVLGVVLGLVFITCIAVGILFWRRRKYLRRGMSEAGTEDTNGHRIMSWMRGHPTEAKAPTVTTDETPMSPEMESVSIAYNLHQSPPPMEMADTQVAAPVELPDTSQPMELHNEALSPEAIVTRHFSMNRDGSSPMNASYYSSVSPADHASTVSQSSGPSAAPANAGLHRAAAPTHISFDQTGYRSESPAPGSPGVEPSQAQAAPATSRHFESGVSGVSSVDRAHLRQISDTTVSSVQSGGFAMHPAPTSVPAPVPEQVTPGSPSLSATPSEGPVSPPSAGVVDGIDYITARRSLGSNGGNGTGSSPLRRSVFQEHPEDLGDGQQQGGSGGQGP
ncbi:hypothetical protein GQ53DRAFT_770595 [Thozetella sp. PMI_491]|nr:hypothetical protein GQ53DRAFT_770595 [Thozetella sp. PMI_491]